MKFHRHILYLLLLCIVFPLLSNADQPEDANAAIKKRYFKEALELLQPLAEEGSEEAQTRLGAMYINGQGVEKDFDKGLSLITKAANQGYVSARRIAFKIHLDLVNQGDKVLLYNLGYMCLEGWGGEQNVDTCLGWLENAAKIGHDNSLKLLAGIYAEGLYGITPDEEKASYWSELKAGFAAGINGQWEGEIPEGVAQPVTLVEPDKNITYYFKTKGNKLTGKVVGHTIKLQKSIYKNWPISGGKIDGNIFSFTVRLLDDHLKYHYTGTFYGDMIKLTFRTQFSFQEPGPPVAITARRVE